MTDRALLTERLCLRGLDRADDPFVEDLIADPEVRRFLGGPVPEADRVAVIERYHTCSENEHVWLVEKRCDTVAVGLVFLSQHHDCGDLELSYQFQSDMWGRGYATEAVGRVLRFAFAELRVTRLVAETQAANAASCRLLDRLGFRLVDRLHRFGAEQVIYAIGAGFAQLRDD